MRSPESEVLRLKEEVQSLQTQLAEAKARQTIINGVPQREHDRAVEAHDREREQWARQRESLKSEHADEIKSLKRTIDRLEMEVHGHRAKDQGAEIAALESKVVRLEQVNHRLAMDNAGIRRSLKKRIDDLEHDKSSLQNRLRRIEQCR